MPEPNQQQVLAAIEIILRHLGQVFDEINGELPPEDKKPGGVFGLAPGSGNNPTPFILRRVGNCKDEKWAFCQEKVARLHAHPEHLTSSQSREPDMMQFGGAIRWNNFILSFSGLPEKWDEELCVRLLSPFFWKSYPGAPPNEDERELVRSITRSIYP